MHCYYSLETDAELVFIDTNLPEEAIGVSDVANTNITILQKTVRKIIAENILNSVSTYLPMKYFLQIVFCTKFNIDVHSRETSCKTC